MSTNGLPLFDKTMHTTNAWLDEINDEIGPDRAFAWRVLSVVLHTLRDRMPLELAAHFGAQLPLLVRGAFYDQFDPTVMPTDIHTREEFLDQVRKGLSDARAVGAEDAVLAVFGVLARHLSAGQIEKVRHAMPKSMRELWPDDLAAPSSEPLIL